MGELNLPTAEPPKQTFDKSPFVLKDDTREVRFHYFGWAHTRGDGFVYLPKEKLLCTGDAATNGPYNYTADANIANWPKVIAAAQKLDVQHELPGHGGLGGKEILDGQARFMAELHKPSRPRSNKARSSTISSSAMAKSWYQPAFSCRIA